MDIESIGTTASFNLVVNLIVGLLVLLFTRLWDSKRWPFGYFMVYQNMKVLRDVAQDLKARADDIKVWVAKAELEQKTCMREVQVWLDRVKPILLDVEDIKLEDFWWRYIYGSVHMIFKLNLVGIWKRYKVGKRITEKLKEVKELHTQGAFSVVATSMPPPAVQEMPCDTKVRAMDLNRDEVLHYLDDDGVEIIGIYGLGGVGKTTLLQEINRYFASRQPLSFSRVIFLVVSQSFDLEELRKQMSEKLGLSSWRRDDIYNFLKNKKLLLLLDDLWDRVELVDLGIPVRERKCKVVFTTRKVDVCGYMEAHKKIQVKCLPAEEAWNLFKEKVGEKTIRSIGCLAKDLAKECDGLPLALITIGRTMSTKKSRVEWEDALNFLRRSQHPNIPGMQDVMFQKLEFSYLNLQNETMRKCFLHCSLWPEDGWIDKDELIVLWMGLGLIDDCDKINEAYDRGYSIIRGLLDSCLLEGCSIERCVKMHDVIRDMAFWIASDREKNTKKWLVQAGMRLKECQPQKWKDRHCISLTHNMIRVLPDRLPKCPNLKILLLQRNSVLKSIPGGFFHYVPALMHLDLSDTDIRELPEELGNLVNLVFLNLSKTDIGSLPKELGNLVNLKYFILSYTRIKSIPIGILLHLQALEFLNLYPCFRIMEEELYRGFEELHRSGRSLKGLGFTVNNVWSLERLSSLTHVFFTIALTIQNLEGVDYFELFSPVLLGGHDIGDNLRELHICSCYSLEVLTMDSSQAVGPARLQKLILENLPLLHEIRCSTLTQKGFLSCLHSVRITACPRLKNVSWVYQLPSLEHLHIALCNEMEVLCDEVEAVGSVGEAAGEEEPITTFPTLRYLSLGSLPILASICNSTFVFPSLEYLDVYDCPCLKKLPFNSNTILNDLEEIIGSRVWWEGLQWEDEHIESSLRKYFKPKYCDEREWWKGLQLGDERIDYSVCKFFRLATLC